MTKCKWQQMTLVEDINRYLFQRSCSLTLKHENQYWVQCKNCWLKANSPHLAHSFHPRKVFSIYSHSMKHECISRNRDAEWGCWFIRGFHISLQTDRQVCVKNDCDSAGRVSQAAGTPCPSSALASERLAPFPAQASIHAQLAQTWPIAQNGCQNRY